MKYVLVVVMLLVGGVGQAHEAPSGWQYPQECCSGYDCDETSIAFRNRDGSLTVRTKNGTATFPKGFPFRQSPDGKIHACFTPSQLRCLFLDGGV